MRADRPRAAACGAILVLLSLGGCAAAVGPLAAASVASVVTTGRDPAGLVASAVSGRDCSFLHLSQQESFCLPVRPPPGAPEYCTRSLGVVDCWDKPNPFGYFQRPVADGPSAETASQAYDRTAHWPDR